MSLPSVNGYIIAPNPVSSLSTSYYNSTRYTRTLAENWGNSAGLFSIALPADTQVGDVFNVSVQLTFSVGSGTLWTNGTIVPSGLLGVGIQYTDSTTTTSGSAPSQAVNYTTPANNKSALPASGMNPTANKINCSHSFVVQSLSGVSLNVLFYSMTNTQILSFSSPAVALDIGNLVLTRTRPSTAITGITNL